MLDPDPESTNPDPKNTVRNSPDPESTRRAVFRIRIHRIHVFFGLPDPDLDQLVRGMDPELWIRIRNPLSSCKNYKKNLESYYFVTLFDFFYL
jgi:hypothetical protein